MTVYNIIIMISKQAWNWIRPYKRTVVMNGNKFGSKDGSDHLLALKSVLAFPQGTEYGRDMK
jgi:hypothetical protein